METVQSGVRMGEWVLEEPLGKGGYATVWRAHHNTLSDKLAAIKVPHDAAFAAMLRKEGRLQHLVSGDHIVSVQGLDPDHDPPYLVVDLIEGVSLRDWLQDGPLPSDVALRVMREVATGLKAAHAQDVVHRDLKPENILIDAAGTAFIGDFGLGITTERATNELLASGSLQTQDGSDLAGTLRYMAPEQRDPEGEVDHRADLYALGVILFEVLTGEAPCGGEVPSDVAPGLDPRLDALYRGLCARLPSRLPDAQAVLDALQAIEAEPAAPPLDPVALAAARSVAIPAGLGMRGLALCVDALPFLMLVLGPLKGARALIAVGLFVAYDVLAVTLSGRTVGKWAFGLRVANGAGGKVDMAQAFQREAFRILSLLSLGLGYLPALLPGQRTFHDAFADTQVLHD